MVNRRLTVVIFGVLACLIAGGVVALRHGSADTAQSPASPGPDRVTPIEQARALSEHEHQTQDRVAAIERLETERVNRLQLEARAQEPLLQLRISRASAWSAILSTNWAAYQELRQKAANAADKAAHCTICNGRGNMPFCIVCHESGKCVTCGGKGKSAYGEQCPTCLGSGRCFLCLGSGGMVCPFCDDGIVRTYQPAPPREMPLPAWSSAPQYAAQAAHPEQSLPVKGTAAHKSERSASPAAAAVTVQEPPTSNGTVATAVILVVAAIFGFIKLAPKIGTFLNSRYDPWEAVNAAAAKVSAEAFAEDKSFSDFVLALHHGPIAPVSSPSPAPTAPAAPVAPTPAETKVEPEATVPEKETNALSDFFDRAPEALSTLKSLFAQVGAASDDQTRQKALLHLLTEVQAFKLAASLPEVMPVWQLACGLEGLLNQLANRSSAVNDSTLRTVAGAITLFETLTIRGLKPDLATNPLARLLVVDDDPISRTAVSSSLKKVFSQPDTAADGEAGLELAEQNPYDIIFLDVEMPGMDGYEVCQKIHETTANKTTPVIFVTRHSDFNARSKSTQSGGQDLIGKPFLSFEIALKALTFVLKNRFEHQAKSEITQTALAEISKAASATDAAKAPQPWLAPARPLQAQTAGARLEPSLSKPENNTPAAQYSTAFFTRGPTHVHAIRKQIESLAFAMDSVRRQEILGALFVSTHALTKNTQRLKLRLAARLCAGVEALLTKFSDNQKQITSSTLASINTALDVLEELCADARHANILNSEIAILVVDDDPISRRAISGAVQLSFGKPDSADNGEEAVARAGEKAYDIIFMDIQMPGLDGFGACAKIRKIELNARTPVVFVTSHCDMESRAKSALAGGDGFISKPTMSAEINLTALTFILRVQLRKSNDQHTSKVIQPAAVPC